MDLWSSQADMGVVHNVTETIRIDFFPLRYSYLKTAYKIWLKIYDVQIRVRLWLQRKLIVLWANRMKIRISWHCWKATILSIKKFADKRFKPWYWTIKRRTSRQIRAQINRRTNRHDFEQICARFWNEKFYRNKTRRLAYYSNRKILLH